MSAPDDESAQSEITNSTNLSSGVCFLAFFHVTRRRGFGCATLQTQTNCLVQAHHTPLLIWPLVRPLNLGMIVGWVPLDYHCHSTNQRDRQES